MFLTLQFEELKCSNTGRFSSWAEQPKIQAFHVIVSLEQRAELQAVSKQKQNLNGSHTSSTEETSLGSSAAGSGIPEG